MRITQVELDENLYVRENDSKSNRGLAWLRVCLYAFPMWVPKGCCIVDTIAIIMVVGYALYGPIYYTFLFWHVNSGLLVNIWFTASESVCTIRSLILLYYCVVQFNPYYFDTQKIKRFSEFVSISVNGFAYNVIYTQTTVFIVVILVLDVSYSAALVYYDDDSKGVNYLIVRYVTHLAKRVFQVFPSMFALCVYSILCCQYQQILDSLTSISVVNYEELFYDYKVLYQSMFDYISLYIVSLLLNHDYTVNRFHKRIQNMDNIYHCVVYNMVF